MKTFRSVFVLLFFVACHKPCVPNHYTFSIESVLFTPNKDSIRIGDTVFLESVTPTKMMDNANGRTVDYSGANNFGSTLGIGEIIGINNIKDAVDSFSFKAIKGSIYSDPKLSPTRVKQIKYLEENGYYRLSIAIIALKRGVYIISTSDMPDVVRKCDRSTIAMKISNNADQHLHYLKDIYYGSTQIDPLDSTHAYCFKVY